MTSGLILKRRLIVYESPRRFGLILAPLVIYEGIRSGIEMKVFIHWIMDSIFRKLCATLVQMQLCCITKSWKKQARWRGHFGENFLMKRNMLFRQEQHRKGIFPIEKMPII